MGCLVDGCGVPAHAKGYCRRHYGQIWRHGAVQPDREDAAKAERRGMRGEQIFSCQREIEGARAIYERACGLQRRLELRRRLTELEAELERLKALPPEGPQVVFQGGRGRRNSRVPDEVLLEFRRRGLTHGAIAERVGLSEVRVGQRLRGMGIQGRVTA